MLEPDPVGFLRNDGGHSGGELLGRFHRIIRFEDPSVGLDHLAERPEGDSIP